DRSERRSRLSPEQREKLQQRLRGGGAPSANAASAAETIVRTEAERVPLSFAQQRQWFLWKLDPASPAYHLSGGLAFSGALDVAALHASLQAIVERHAAL